MNAAELRAIRRRAGLTQAALAELLGTGQPFIADLERGRWRVPPAHEARLAALAQGGLCRSCWCVHGRALPCGCPEGRS